MTTIPSTMTAFRHKRVRNIGVLLACMLFAGCATQTERNPPGPDRTQPDQAEEDRSGFAVNESTDVDGDVREDFDKAMTYLESGKYQEGTKLLHSVMQRSPRHIASHINLAVAYQRMENLSAAEDSIKKALELNPEHTVANTEYGLIFRKTGRFAEARQAYERALQRNPAFLPARKNLGILCDVYVRDLECALDHYRVYSRAVPGDNAVRIWIADLEKRLGK